MAEKKKEAPKKRKKKNAPGAGRPSTLTDKSVSILLDALKIGAKPGEACAAAGINRKTYYRNLKEKPEFRDKVINAKAECILGARKSLYAKVLLGDHNCLKLFLRSKLPEEFGNKIEVSGNKKKPLIPRQININLVKAPKRGKK